MRKLSKQEVMMIESLYDFSNRDLLKQTIDFKDFTETLAVLQDYLVQSQVKIPKYKTHIDTLITKYLYHSNTISHLLRGIEMNFDKIRLKAKIIDIPSLFILLRALLENFLIFDFIYCQPATSDESEFRHNCWKLSAYLSRKDIPAEGEENIKIKKSDIKEIERLRKLIKQSKHFDSFSEKQKSNILCKGEEKLGLGWVKIMINSGINHRIANSLYKLISSYAHSSGLSIFNITQLKAGYHPNHDKANLIVSIAKMITARFIIRFKSQVKTVELKYNMLPRSTIEKMEFYDSIISRKTIF